MIPTASFDTDFLNIVTSIQFPLPSQQKQQQTHLQDSLSTLNKNTLVSHT